MELKCSVTKPSQSPSLRSNRTFMELKYAFDTVCIGAEKCSNRTFMELK